MVQRSGGSTLNLNVMNVFPFIISVKIFIRGSISRMERWANGAHLQLRSYSSSTDEILLHCHCLSDFSPILHWLSSNALNLQWLRDNVYFADFLPGGTHTPRSALKKRFEECLFFCGNKGYPPLGKVVNIEDLSLATTSCIWNWGKYFGPNPQNSIWPFP